MNFLHSSKHNAGTQIQQLYVYLHENIVTASMAAKQTGIPQKNICRYKRYLEKKGLLLEVFKAPCLETGREAWYLSTALNFDFPT